MQQGFKPAALRNIFIIAAINLYLSACETGKPLSDVMLPQETQTSKTFIQSKKFEKISSQKLLIVGINVLQDMGYIINNADMELGIIIADKYLDAIDKLRFGLVTASNILSLIAGSYDNNQLSYKNISSKQKIKVCVIANNNRNNRNENISLRVNFQRILWDMEGNIMTQTLINTPKLYNEFFSKLSKSVFLEENEV